MSKFKTAEIKGYRSLRALNVFSTLLLGMKMLPMYLEIPYEEFYESFSDMPEEEKESMLRQAVAFVRLEQDEVEAMVSFVLDPNGVPYSPINLKKASPAEIHDMIVAVGMEIGRIKVDLVSEEEKKKFQNSQWTFGRHTSNILN
jgi:hypothetical protein